MADYIIEIRIPEAKASTFMTYFLARHPKPQTFTGTDKEWVKNRLVDWVNRKYRAGYLKKGNVDTNVAF